MDSQEIVDIMNIELEIEVRFIVFVVIVHLGVGCRYFRR